MGHGVRRLASCEKSEDERRAGLGRSLEGLEARVEREDGFPQPRHRQQQARQRHGERHPGGDDPPAHGTAILGEYPGDGEEEGGAGEGVQGLHGPGIILRRGALR